MLLRAVFLTLGQIADPVFRGVLLRSVLFTVILFVALSALFFWASPNVTYFKWDWLNTLVEAGGALAFFAVLVLAFSTSATLISGFFLDDIAGAVEQHHYVGDPPGRPVDFSRSFAVSLRFMGITLLLNILALPLYLIALLFPPLFAFIFYTLNGYLLSREYFDLVSLRHLDEKQARQLRKSNQTKVFLAGVIITFFITVPILNLVVPILATAFMLHIFKSLQLARTT